MRAAYAGTIYSSLEKITGSAALINEARVSRARRIGPFSCAPRQILDRPTATFIRGRSRVL